MGSKCVSWGLCDSICKYFLIVCVADALVDAEGVVRSTV